MNQQKLYQIGRLAMHAYTRLLLDADIHYNAALPTGAKIIAPNHPTTLDPFLLPAFYDEQIHILVTESAFKAPLFGRYLRAAGHVEVVAEQGRGAFEAAQQLLLEGKTIAIFPEGALSPLYDSFPRAHTGVVRLSLLTGAPVIPVGIAVQPHRVRFIHTGIHDHQGEEEIARGYLHAPYGITSGLPLIFNGDVEDRAWVRQLSDRLMQHILRLSRQSAYRIHAYQPKISLYNTVEIPSF